MNDELINACKEGDLNKVKYLFENKAPIDKYAIELAAKYKHFDIVKYLVNKLKL